MAHSLASLEDSLANISDTEIRDDGFLNFWEGELLLEVTGIGGDGQGSVGTFIPSLIQPLATVARPSTDHGKASAFSFVLGMLAGSGLSALLIQSVQSSDSRIQPNQCSFRALLGMKLLLSGILRGRNAWPHRVQEGPGWRRWAVGQGGGSGHVGGCLGNISQLPD